MNSKFGKAIQAIVIILVVLVFLNFMSFIETPEGQFGTFNPFVPVIGAVHSMTYNMGMHPMLSTGIAVILFVVIWWMVYRLLIKLSKKK
ncbi:MAG: hypothetical protein ACRDCN_00965 [Tannerellaceae bacterium]